MKVYKVRMNELVGNVKIQEGDLSVRGYSLMTHLGKTRNYNRSMANRYGMSLDQH